MLGKRAGAIDIAVAARVRTHRKALGLSQTDIAEKLGVTFQQVQKYENGTNRIGAGRLFELARILQVPIQSLYPEQSRGEPDSSSRNPPPQELAQLFVASDGWKLFRAFSKIKDPAVRKAMVALMEQVSVEVQSQCDVLG